VQRAARARAAGAPAAVRCTVADPGDPVALVRLGAGVHRLRAALAAEGLASAATVPAAGVVLVLAGPPGEVDPR
jgi:coenzyme F420-0:L-glutamate ligase/coenzyme F420-1:gamma-L-glutamate ligase